MPGSSRERKLMCGREQKTGKSGLQPREPGPGQAQPSVLCSWPRTGARGVKVSDPTSPLRFSKAILKGLLPLLAGSPSEGGAMGTGRQVGLRGS